MKNKIILELIWWIATLVIVALFLLPILNYIGAKYSFYPSNIFFIAIFITFTRYIFLLKHTYFAHNRPLKLILIFLPIPLFFYSIDALFNFQNFIDQGGHIEMLNHLHPDTAMNISKYIKYQFVFFGTGAFFVIFLLPIRLIISIWRGINKGTV
jgi:glucan phosphoethanolaminetransferase (alkaline phosphatase superfamily)